MSMRRVRVHVMHFRSDGVTTGRAFRRDKRQGAVSGVIIMCLVEGFHMTTKPSLSRTHILHYEGLPVYLHLSAT